MDSNKGFKEERIRRVTSIYYSKPEIQEAIFKFSGNREICPRYFEGFGKRPDVLEYPGDVFELVKRGATSFHCSEEIWDDPLKIQTGMSEKQLNDFREGWDLLIDIDCKWFDYSKLAAKSIVSTLRKNGIKNIGIKFSGSKGFHIIVPWKAFPKTLAGEPMKNLFPEVPRKIVSFLRFKAEEEMKNSLPEDFYDQFKNVDIKKGKKCNNCRSVAEEYISTNYICEKCRRQEIRKIPLDNKKVFKCPDCRFEFSVKSSKEISECTTCNISSEKNPENFSRNVEVDLFDLMGLDLVLVSPRHLFRMPYSLHEKTALASVVISENELEDFDMKSADPMKVEVKDFLPVSEENEANELIREALDWVKENQLKKGISEDKVSGKYADYKPINLKDFSEDQLPPSIKKILEGLGDGKKRALFVLINLFRSIGLEKEDLEKRISDWNKKNEVPLREGYIKTQLIWAYRKKPIMPPNFSTDYYKGLGVVPTIEEMNYKNPVSYILSKNSRGKKSK